MNQQRTVESRVLSILKDCPRARFDDTRLLQKLTKKQTVPSLRFPRRKARLPNRTVRRFTPSRKSIRNRKRGNQL